MTKLGSKTGLGVFGAVAVAALGMMMSAGAAQAQSVSGEQYIPTIWVDPDGCEHWVMDGGAEGYMTPHTKPPGHPSVSLRQCLRCDELGSAVCHGQCEYQCCRQATPDEFLPSGRGDLLHHHRPHGQPCVGSVQYEPVPAPRQFGGSGGTVQRRIFAAMASGCQRRPTGRLQACRKTVASKSSAFVEAKEREHEIWYNDPGALIRRIPLHLVAALGTVLLPHLKRFTKNLDQSFL